MRWLLPILVLCAAAVLWGWQALGLGVDLAGSSGDALGRSARSVAHDGRAPTQPLTAVALPADLRAELRGHAVDTRARDTLERGPSPFEMSTSPAVLDGPAARQAMALLRARIDRPALEALASRLAVRVDREPEDADALLVLCEASRLLGRVDDAERYAAAAVERFPHLARAHLEQARALAERMKRAGMLRAMRFLGEFKQALGRALELDPHDVEARCDRIGFLSFAPGLLGGDAELALRMARELGREQPVRGLVMEAVALLADGREDDAVARARAALAGWQPLREAHDEGLRQAHLVLAGSLVETEAFGEAAEHYELAAAGPSDTVHFQALYMHAKLRVEQDMQHAEALADLQEYLEAEPYGELMPFLGAAHWRAGQALEGLGREREALAAYERAVAAEPGFDKAVDARDELLDRL